MVSVGRGSNRREEKRKHNISLTHTCTTCCLCVQVWHAGGGGHELLVVRNASSGACCCCCVSSVHWHMHWVRFGIRMCVRVCVRRGRLSERSSDVEVVVSQVSAGDGVSMGGG